MCVHINRYIHMCTYVWIHMIKMRPRASAMIGSAPTLGYTPSTQSCKWGCSSPEGSGGSGDIMPELLHQQKPKMCMLLF